MSELSRRAVLGIVAVGVAGVRAARAGAWTAPVEVQYELKRCLAYRARLAREFLIVEAAIEPGWHTFAMDNQRRAAEKLAGKQSLGIEQPTQIKVTGGLEIAGAWRQTPPKDFSKPELRWFTWGFEKQAIFAVKVRRSGPGPARIAIRGQACTESICKNIDVAISLPLTSAATDPSDFNIGTLVQVRNA